MGTHTRSSELRGTSVWPCQSHLAQVVLSASAGPAAPSVSGLWEGKGDEVNLYVILFKTTFFLRMCLVIASINTTVKMLNYIFQPSVFNNSDEHVKKISLCGSAFFPRKTI